MLTTKDVAKLIGKTEGFTRSLALNGTLGKVVNIGSSDDGRTVALFFYDKKKIASYLNISDEMLKRKVRELYEQV